MDVPAARFSRALGHKVGSLVGVINSITVEHLQLDLHSFMKIKILMLSSQLTYVAANQKFKEIFVNFKFAEEDLISQVASVMKGLEKNEQLLYEDYGLIYVFQN